MNLGRFLLILVCGVGPAMFARGAVAETCQEVQPKPFPSGQPFLLNDPRTGLMLYVESDGRHMAAITRGGKILWHKDLFADPKLEREIWVPPPKIDGQPSPSPEQWQEQVRAMLKTLSIDASGSSLIVCGATSVTTCLLSLAAITSERAPARISTGS